MPTLDSIPQSARFSPRSAFTLWWVALGALWVLPGTTSAQPPPSCETVTPAGLPHTGGPDCAPDQGLSFDAARPARRFATYSDLASLVRSRVSVGLVVVPFSDGPLGRLRVDVEAVTRLRAPRGITLMARVGVNLLGQGLDALSLAGSVGYEVRAQDRGGLMVGAELGYARHFQGLYLAASLGGTVHVWPDAGRGSVAPVVRLALGHAFY